MTIVNLHNLKVCSRGSNAAWHYSTDAQNWTEVQDYPTGGEYRRIAAIDNIFIAVSYSGTQRVVRSEGGVGGSLTTLTFATASNLDKFNAGADVKMTDAAGNDATYQPVTSQITGIQPILPLDDSTDKVDVDMTAQFAGITHITGFSVKNRSTDQTPSQYTTELHNLKVDGAFIKGTNVVVTEGEPYASSTWENFLTGDDVNAGGYNAQGQNNLDYSCTCDPIDIRGYSTITSWIGYGRFSVLDQNGNERFITGGSGSNLTLTLTDEQDLKYFRQGDVVQAPDVKVVSTRPRRSTTHNDC